MAPAGKREREHGERVRVVNPGNVSVERLEVPEGVRGSVEFVSACPESARAMFLPLYAHGG
jgi:hypothetical protein